MKCSALPVSGFASASARTAVATIRPGFDRSPGGEGRSRRRGTIEKNPGLTHALRGLADEAPGDQKTAVTGWTCRYEFTLDGWFIPDVIGGTTFGYASIGSGSTSAKQLPKHTAYTYVSATGETTYYAEDYDEILSGPGTAETSTFVNCGLVFDCASWESFSYVREYQCTGGYRSIQRMG